MGGDGKLFTLAEVSKHSNSHDCWIVIYGKVYDVTNFLDDHPGGDEVILTSTGKDATADFEDVGHGTTAKAMLDKYYVGDIDSATLPIKTKFVPPLSKQAETNQVKSSDFRFASMLPQTAKIGRGSNSKDEDQALGPGHMRISIVVPTGRSSTPEERQSVKDTIQQLQDILRRIE